MASWLRRSRNPRPGKRGVRYGSCSEAKGLIYPPTTNHAPRDANVVDTAVSRLLTEHRLATSCTPGGPGHKAVDNRSSVRTFAQRRNLHGALDAFKPPGVVC